MRVSPNAGFPLSLPLLMFSRWSPPGAVFGFPTGAALAPTAAPTFSTPQAALVAARERCTDLEKEAEEAKAEAGAARS